MRPGLICAAWTLTGVLVLAAPPVFSQQASSVAASRKAGPLVVLTRLSSPSGDTVAKTLASAISASVDLVLRLSGSVRVQRADFLDPTANFIRSQRYYRQVGADGAVYGSVSPGPNGSYLVDLRVWNAGNSAAKSRSIKRNIADLLSSFSLSDSLALEVGSTLLGRKLSEGTLVVKNVESLPHYSIYADGQLLGRNRSSFRVLTGERTIVIAKPGQVGDVAVATFHVHIKQGATTTVRLSPVSPTAKKGTLTIDVNPVPKVHGAIRVRLSRGDAKSEVTITRSGSGRSPFVFDLNPGTYRVMAGFENDVSFPSFEGRARVASDSMTRMKMQLNYSSAYIVAHRISHLQSERAGQARKLSAIDRARSGWTIAGTSLTAAGGLSEVGAAIAWLLASNDYSNYSGATSSIIALHYRSAVSTDRTVFLWTSIGGGASLLLGVIGFLVAPSTDKVQHSIRQLDAALSALRTKEKSVK